MPPEHKEFQATYQPGPIVPYPYAAPLAAGQVYLSDVLLILDGEIIAADLVNDDSAEYKLRRARAKVAGLVGK